MWNSNVIPCMTAFMQKQIKTEHFCRKLTKISGRCCTTAMRLIHDVIKTCRTVHRLKYKRSGQLNSPFSPFPNPRRGTDSLFHWNNPHWIYKSNCVLCSGRLMRTAVMGPIVNVPSLHLTSSADTASDGLVSSSLNLLCACVCQSDASQPCW